MAKRYKNITAGPKGFYTADGELVMVESGQLTPEGVEFGPNEPVKDWFGSPNAEVEQAQALSEVEQLRAENERLRAQLAALDGDGDGKAGGTKPSDPPALSGLTKAELLEVAKAESVELSEEATKAEILEAIEAKRAA